MGSCGVLWALYGVLMGPMGSSEVLWGLMRSVWGPYGILSGFYGVPYEVLWDPTMGSFWGIMGCYRILLGFVGS